MLFIGPLGEYPRHIGDVQIEHPNWTPEDSLPDGWSQVTETPFNLEVGENQTAYEAAPQEVDGLWRQVWAVRDLTEAEIERKNAPSTLITKLKALGLTDVEIDVLYRNMRQ
jgi:hypothetical protein